MNVGIIGLGAMGSRMVAPLLASDLSVVAYDLSPAAIERAVAAGAAAAGSTADVGAAVDVVLLSLPTPVQVEAVVVGEAGLLSCPADGLVIVDTSTVDPGTTRRLADQAAVRGVGYLDAPVLGRPDACGRWTLPVGGDSAILDVVRPALAPLARAIVHVGPPGSGNAIKLLNTLMFGAINAITSEVLAISARVGVSPRLFFETVALSEAATVSPLFRQLGPKILDRDFLPVFTVDLLHKDNRLALEMIHDAGASLIVANAVNVLNGLAVASGHGGDDTSAVVQVYEALLGVESTNPG